MLLLNLKRDSLYDSLRIVVGGFFVIFFLISLTGLSLTGFAVNDLSNYPSRPEASLLMLSLLGFFVLFITNRKNS